jgi:nitronate monooxygenase/enoyl-[acyl-carrier protein] reductase II
MTMARADLPPQEVAMLRTPLCDLVGIDVPVIQAGMSIYTSPELAAAVSNAGALGSLGAWQRPADQLRRELDELRAATERPFAVNHVVPDLVEDALAVTLEYAPAVVSFALDDAGDLIRRVHDTGSLAMQQVTTVKQAEAAVEHGVDIVVAQGGEAGGYAGAIGTMSLVPQVVDAVRPVPVLAAGGIADGRGLAAALVLGASGANLGSRFLASDEAPVGERWKKALLSAPAEDWVQAEFMNVLRPNPGAVGYGTRVRLLRTEYVDRWESQLDALTADAAPALTELMDAVAAGDEEQLVVPGGQSAGLLDRLMPAREIVDTLVREAEAALRSGRAATG